MYLQSDEQILDERFRALIIQEIKGAENQERKAISRKRHELYKDKIKPWVIDALRKEGLKESTLSLMSNRAASINILKKVINKLSRSYLGDVQRTFLTDEFKKFGEMEALLDISNKMRKADRLEKLQNNVLLGVLPVLESEYSDASTAKYSLELRVLEPWQYDIIEDCANKEKAKCVILSDTWIGSSNAMLSPQLTGEWTNGKDDVIADSPSDSGKVESGESFIFWTKTYHFTCDKEGKIIGHLSPPDLLNPINIMPWVTLSEKQDGQYWAQGGDDLIDGTVLVNVLLTDMAAIANVQGWGQMVITGSNIPDTISGGPHKAIILEQRAGDTPPTVTYETANPPMDSWSRMVEQYVALLLTTNDLSPGQVALTLDGASPASGVSLMIDRSEALDNVKDRQKMFINAERRIWLILQAWQNILFDAEALIDPFYVIGTLPDSDVTIKFHEARATLTEKERLENMKAKKELGIVDLVDLIRIDNPDLSEEEAEKKALSLIEGKLKGMIQDKLDKAELDDPSYKEPKTPELDMKEDMKEESNGEYSNTV